MHAYRQGESGPAVAEIRGILAHLGLLDMSAENGANAEFDRPTEAAVRQFQQSRGLNVDGKVGTGDMARVGGGPLEARRPHALPLGQ